jgi:predicted transcriptional regulator
MDRPESVEVVRLLLRRAPLLDSLAAGPASKRNLVDRHDVSRSTVDRAVRELEEKRLVERTADGVALTLPGRVALDEYDDCLDLADGLAGAARILDALPADAPLDPAMLRGVRVVGTEQHAPHRPVKEFTSLVSGADAVRVVLATYVPEHVEACCDPATDRGSAAELVLTEPVISSLAPESEAALRRATDASLSAYRIDGVPYSLAVAERDDSGRAGVLVADESGVRGLVVNDAADAVAWADRQFETCRERAERANF